jgi:hypothetical protein
MNPLIKKLDTVFSQFIRLRDSNSEGICRCITCGSLHHFKQIDCGHYIKRQYMSTRFNEFNCHAQCRKCNWLEQGADAKYREAIIKKFGQEVHDLLIIQKYSTKKWTKFELEYLIKDYTDRVKILLKEKI